MSQLFTLIRTLTSALKLYFLCVSCKKINKRKSQIELGDQQGEPSHPGTWLSPTGRRKSSFLARSQPVKSHGLFIYHSPPHFHFPSMKAFPFLCHLGTCMAYGLPWLQTPSYNSLLILSKLIFVGETSASLSQVNTLQIKEYMYFLKELRKMKRMNGKVKKSN